MPEPTEVQPGLLGPLDSSETRLCHHGRELKCWEEADEESSGAKGCFIHKV